MKKNLVLSILIVLSCATAGWCGSETDLANQVAELSRQNKELLARVAALEKIVGGRTYPAGEADSQGGEKGGVVLPPATVAVDNNDEADRAGEEIPLVRMINDRVELGGLVEVEAGSVEDFAGEGSSDITLATVALHLDAKISEWSLAHVLLLHEEGEEDDHVTVDEGTITLGSEEKFPAYLTVGRMYLPFGAYESNMISDTLPLELGEISDTGVLARGGHAGFRGAVYAFNGDLAAQGGSDRIEAWGASLGYAHEGDEFSLAAGLDWLRNIGDSDGLGDYLEEKTGAAELEQYVDGLAAHLLLQYGPFAFIAEYLSALAEFAAAEMAFAGSGAQPEAWSLEVGWSFDLLQRETVFSISWQGTDESLALSLPEDRYLAAIRMMILANTSLALELLHDQDYAISAGGTGESGDAATLQLAVEF